MAEQFAEWLVWMQKNNAQEVRMKAYVDPTQETPAPVAQEPCDPDPNSDKHDWNLTEAAARYHYYQCAQCGMTAQSDSGV